MLIVTVMSVIDSIMMMIDGVMRVTCSWGCSWWAGCWTITTITITTIIVALPTTTTIPVIIDPNSILPPPHWSPPLHPSLSSLVSSHSPLPSSPLPLFVFPLMATGSYATGRTGTFMMMCYADACYYCLRSSTGTIVTCIAANWFTIMLANVSVMTITKTCPQSGSI